MMKRCIILFLILTLCGCWPFQPRNAETPTTNTPYVPARDPSEIPGILQSVYINGNTSHLNSLLASGFISRTDASEITGSRTFNKSTEMNVAEQIINSYTTVNVTFQTIPEYPDPVANPNTSVWIRRSYTIQTVTSGGAADNYSGNAAFYCTYKSATAEWILTEWDDFKTDTLRTWGQLKINHQGS